MKSNIASIETTVQKTSEWLHEIADKANWSVEQAYIALRVVLHQLRDNLMVETTAHLSAQLPILIRGLFFENWKPEIQPLSQRSYEDFLCSIAEQLLSYHHSDINPEVAIEAVFSVLWSRLPQEELLKLCSTVPRGVRQKLSQAPSRKD